MAARPDREDFPKIEVPDVPDVPGVTDLLFEVHGWTGFLDAFMHLGDGRTHVKDLTTRSSPSS
ncbi:hypothetical protein OG756_06095 [Streptomyces sp. NBC_01310]|nr:hypothetical protein OG756_06095 [Streptomyces sp. NBC_01310]